MVTSQRVSCILGRSTTFNTFGSLPLGIREGAHFCPDKATPYTFLSSWYCTCSCYLGRLNVFGRWKREVLRTSTALPGWVRYSFGPMGLAWVSQSSVGRNSRYLDFYINRVYCTPCKTV